MIGAVAAHEIRTQLRDGRQVVLGAALLLALLGAFVSGWVQFDRASAERESFVAAAREQWLHQGVRHPHRAAHFGAYVAKPELPLALFEPGLRPFAGQTLWLEAHDRPAFANVPSEDDLTLGVGLGVASGAAVLQMLGGLLALLTGALAIVREREAGTLRQILGQGVSPQAWAWGKLAGLGAALAVPLAPVAVAAIVVAIAASPATQRADVAARGFAMLAVDTALLATLLIVGLAISAGSRSSRGAVAAALAVWVAVFIVAPRAASTLCERLAPVPTLSAYQDEAGAMFAGGIDSRGGYDAQLSALEAETLRRYQVNRLADLPVGFSGLRMRLMDRWGAEVDDREFAKLEAAYARQNRIRASLSVAAPFIAARTASQAMAGMDWPHYRDFLRAAEAYRRKFGAQMNALLTARLRGERWETDGGNSDWAKVGAFGYATPGVGWAMRQQAVAIAILSLWLAGAAVLLSAVCRRLKP